MCFSSIAQTVKPKTLSFGSSLGVVGITLLKMFPREVICVETGKVYPSLRQAAWDLGTNYQGIVQAIKKPCRCAGYHWKFVDENPPTCHPSKRNQM
eukprot:g73357.t1